MNALKMILVTVVSIATFAGCAKKDNSFASKYAKNTLGANAINPETTANAYQNAGFVMDLIDISTLPQSTSATFYFTTTVLLGDTPRQFTTAINAASAGNIITTSSSIGGRRVDLSSKCANTDCNPWYFVATAYEGNIAKLQLGYKFVRLGTIADDRYQALGPGQINSAAEMMNYLNSN